MPRGLDHIVHAVRDLDAAAELYRGLGFTVGARNKHPWGTHNHIVQLPGFFIELLTLAEPDKLGSDGFSRMFGAYNGDFLKRGEGLSLLILESHDAVADEASFRKAGIATAEVMHFEREGKRPDGATVKLAFSLAFAEDKAAPDIHFAVCQQHYPENFWNPAFQKHANSVTGVAGAVVVANDPGRHRDFFQNFAGAAAKQADDGFIDRNAARRYRCGDAHGFHRPFRRWRAGHLSRRTACRHPVCRSRRKSARKRHPNLPAWPGSMPEIPQSSVLRMPWARCWCSSLPVDRLGCTVSWSPPRGLHLNKTTTPNAVVAVGAVRFGNALPLALIAGPVRWRAAPMRWRWRPR